MEKVKLGDVCKVQGGYAFRSSEFQKDSIPIIRIGNIQDNEVDIDYNVCYTKDFLNKHPEFEIEYGDILIAMSGATVGKIGKYQKETNALLNQRVGKFIVTEKLEKRYLYFLLQSPLFEKYILSNAFGCAQPNISSKQIEEFEFYNYDNAEQLEIANQLDTVQKIINIRKKQVKQFEELIKSQFVEMFGDIKDYKKLEEFSILITKGASPRWQGIDYKSEGTLFVTSENVREGYIDISKPKYLDNKINEILPRSILKRNDILINIVGASIGRAGKYDYDYLANINQAVALVRTENINNIFLLQYLNSEEAIKTYNDMKKGGARENLSLRNIADLKIPNASIELQNKFAEFVKQVDKQKFEIQKNLEEMQLLQESLMDKYFG